MKRIVLLLALVVVVMIVSGCAQKNMIRTEPPGAKIYVDGSYAGESPLQYTFDRPFRYSYFIEAKLDGYHTEATTARLHRDFWGKTKWDDVFMRLQRK